MKQDLNSTNTHTNNHCRWKSGYLSYLYTRHSFTYRPGFRKAAGKKRIPRKTGPPFIPYALVIRFLHSQPCAILRRPVPSVGIPPNQHIMRQLRYTSFSHASNYAEDKQANTIFPMSTETTHLDPEGSQMDGRFLLPQQTDLLQKRTSFRPQRSEETSCI